MRSQIHKMSSIFWLISKQHSQYINNLYFIAKFHELNNVFCFCQHLNKFPKCKNGNFRKTGESNVKNGEISLLLFFFNLKKFAFRIHKEFC